MAWLIFFKDGKLLSYSNSSAQYAVHKFELKPGISLTCIETDKFKSGCLTINMLTQLRQETAALNALLPRVLRRGSSKLQDMQSISAALDDLYGVRVEPIVRKKGEVHSLGFYADFVDDCYIHEDESILENSIDIVGEILTSPYMDNDFLSQDYTESEKANLIDDIRAVINDKQGYATNRLLEEMCNDEAFGISKLGTEEEARSITYQTLTTHYHDVINNSRIEIIYCGSAEPNRVVAAFKSTFSSLSARPDAVVPKTSIIYSPISDTVRRFEEKLDVSQGKLVIGFRMGDTMKDPDFTTLVLLNAIYGGSITSKLFLNVREKLSLCYYASSMIDKFKGIMLVSSGVEFSNFEVAFDEILSQLSNVQRGEISDWEFTSAKRSIVTSAKSALDRPGGIEELYFDSAISEFPYDPLDLSNMVQDVTLENVIAAASGIKIDSVYLLSGFEDIADGGETIETN